MSIRPERYECTIRNTDNPKDFSYGTTVRACSPANAALRAAINVGFDNADVTVADNLARSASFTVRTTQTQR